MEKICCFPFFFFFLENTQSERNELEMATRKNLVDHRNCRRTLLKLRSKFRRDLLKVKSAGYGSFFIRISLKNDLEKELILSFHSILDFNFSQQNGMLYVPILFLDYFEEGPN